MRGHKAGLRISILSPHYQKFVLQHTLDALNSATQRQPVWVNATDWKFESVDCKERQEELRSLIGRWIDARRDLNLFKDNPDVAESCSRGTTQLVPDCHGFPQLAWFPHIQGSKSTPQKVQALAYFVEFIVCPLSRSLEGTCKRCGRYYRKADPRQTIYCRKRCSSAETAVACDPQKARAGIRG